MIPDIRYLCFDSYVDKNLLLYNENYKESFLLSIDYLKLTVSEANLNFKKKTRKRMHPIRS